MEKTFKVMFIEDSYTFNDVELRTCNGEKYYVSIVKAQTPEEAYHSALKRVREKVQNTVRLNYCKLVGGA